MVTLMRTWWMRMLISTRDFHICTGVRAFWKSHPHFSNSKFILITERVHSSSPKCNSALCGEEHTQSKYIRESQPGILVQCYQTAGYATQYIGWEYMDIWCYLLLSIYKVVHYVFKHPLFYTDLYNLNIIMTASSVVILIMIKLQT